jgi:hypothetical protein
VLGIGDFPASTIGLLRRFSANGDQFFPRDPFALMFHKPPIDLGLLECLALALLSFSGAKLLLPLFPQLQMLLRIPTRDGNHRGLIYRKEPAPEDLHLDFGGRLLHDDALDRPSIGQMDDIRPSWARPHGPDQRNANPTHRAFHLTSPPPVF